MTFLVSCLGPELVGVTVERLPESPSTPHATASALQRQFLQVTQWAGLRA